MNLSECIAFSRDRDLPFQARDYDQPEHYTREGEVHCTSSAFLCNETLDKVLFVYHNIYRSYTWAGGHNDGERDFLKVAIKEAKEETGIEKLTLYSAVPLHVGFIPVKAHEKKGKKIPAHTHLNVTFALIVSEREKIRTKEDENSDVKWLPMENLESYCTEAHMISLYRSCISVLKEIKRKKDLAFSALPSLLLPWYDQNKRDLPWRHEVSAYRTWISEIMLQQTRVEAGKSYFLRFVKELPNVEELAKCPEEKLLKLWEGLGYYNRAKNLQKTANIIVKDYGGTIPKDAETLKTLPGIGEYTAGAISSIAYGRKEPAVDGNVVRVLSRITERYEVDLKKKLFSSLKEIYPDRAGDFTQSLMELGATVCLPNGQPLCEKCPMKNVCRARELGIQSSLPVLPEKRERKKKEVIVYHIQTPKGIVLKKRTEQGVLQGLWEYPNFDEECLRSLPVKNPRELYRKEHTHIFTHLEWHMVCIYVQADDTEWDTYNKETIRTELSIPSAFQWIDERS